MKKIIWILAIAFMLPAWSQNKVDSPENKEERKKAVLEKKLAYLRENLMLTDKEYKPFKDVFMQYEQEKWKLFDQKKQLMNALRGKKTADLSDAEINKKLDEIIRLEEQIFMLKKDFHQKAKKILPPRKLMRYYKENMKFNRMLLKNKRKRTMRKNKMQHKKYNPAHTPRR